MTRADPEEGTMLVKRAEMIEGTIRLTRADKSQRTKYWKRSRTERAAPGTRREPPQPSAPLQESKTGTTSVPRRLIEPETMSSTELGMRAIDLMSTKIRKRASAIEPHRTTCASRDKAGHQPTQAPPERLSKDKELTS
jgi:hypothetical protein